MRIRNSKKTINVQSGSDQEQESTDCVEIKKKKKNDRINKENINVGYTVITIYYAMFYSYVQL